MADDPAYLKDDKYLRQCADYVLVLEKALRLACHDSAEFDPMSPEQLARELIIKARAALAARKAEGKS